MKEQLFVEAFDDYARCIDFANDQKADAYTVMAFQLNYKQGTLNKQEFMSYSAVFLKQAEGTNFHHLLKNHVEELEGRYF